MESQEALKRIKREARIPYFSTLYDIDMWREDFKTIEEDLEILEIFKKINFKMLEPFNTLYPKAITVEFSDNITEEEYEKWLKWRKKK